MTTKINDQIKSRILAMDEGNIFFTSDFSDITSLTTTRKCLGRLANDGIIRRIMDGAYEKPKFSKLLNAYLPANPEKVAYAIAKKYHWTIASCGDVALNKLGLSTQIPVVWTYVSDGPYREFFWDNTKISFKHKTNREISNMSELSAIVVEAIKTLGKERVDEKVISTLRNRLSSKDKKVLISETADVASWVYEIIRKVCS